MVDPNDRAELFSTKTKNGMVGKLLSVEFNTIDILLITGGRLRIDELCKRIGVGMGYYVKQTKYMSRNKLIQREAKLPMKSNQHVNRKNNKDTVPIQFILPAERGVRLFHEALGEEYDEDYYHNSFVVPDDKHVHFELQAAHAYVDGRRVLGNDVFYNNYRLEGVS